MNANPAFQAVRVRREPKARRGLRIPRGTPWLLLALVVVVGLWQAASRIELPLRGYSIAGSHPAHMQADVEKLMVAHLGRPFVTASVAGLRDELIALPWVRDAAVRRLWPDRVELVLTPQSAVARWGDEGLVNADGEVFMPSLKTRPLGLPLLMGPDGLQADVLDGYRRLAARAARDELTIASVAINARRAWSVWLDNGLLIELGREEPGPRFDRLLRVFASDIRRHAGEMTRVDVRYTNGFVVQWRPRPDAAPAGRLG